MALNYMPYHQNFADSITRREHIVLQNERGVFHLHKTHQPTQLPSSSLNFSNYATKLHTKTGLSSNHGTGQLEATATDDKLEGIEHAHDHLTCCW